MRECLRRADVPALPLPLHPQTLIHRIQYLLGAGLNSHPYFGAARPFEASDRRVVIKSARD